MSAPAPEPTLEDIDSARMATSGNIPKAVIEAFLPIPTSHLGQKLVPLSAGHELLLAQIRHPLATGAAFEDIDILMALFIFSRPSRETFSLIADDTFEVEFFIFIDGIPAADIPKLGHDMVAYWLKARATALAMENKHGSGQKKTAVSGGGSTRLPLLAKSMAGFQRWLSTTFHSAKSSH